MQIGLICALLLGRYLHAYTNYSGNMGLVISGVFLFLSFGLVVSAVSLPHCSIYS